MSNTNNVTEPIGEPLFVIHTLADYQKASTCFFESGDRIGVDAQGRHCLEGKDFDQAHYDGAFPVTIHRKGSEA